MIETLAGAVKLAAAAVLALVAGAYLFQERLIFFPQRLARGAGVELARHHPAASTFALAAADGVRLRGWLVDAGPGTPTVLYFGGNAEEVSWMLDAVGDPARGRTPGVSWLLVNYRGYGESEGRPSEAALIADARALYDELARRRRGESARLYAFGRSLGSAVAVALAAERPLAGVILVTPFDSLVAVGERHYRLLPVRWLLRHRFDSAARAPGIRTPALFLIAERDTIVPPEHGERLHALWDGPKRIIHLAGADHNGTDAAPGFWSAVREFLAQGV